MKIGEVLEHYSEIYPDFDIRCNDTYEMVRCAMRRHGSKGLIEKAQEEFELREDFLKKLGFTHLGKEFVGDSNLSVWGIKKEKLNAKIKEKLIEMGL